MTKAQLMVRTHGVTLLLVFISTSARAQSAGTPPQRSPDEVTNSRLDSVSRLLTDTQRQLEQTQQQLIQLRSELDQLRGHDAAAEKPATVSPPNEAASSSSLSEQVNHQQEEQEEQEVLEAEVKQHDQTKLESLSKYPVRVYGLMLFTAYSNAGVVDNPSLPSIALSRMPDQSHGSVGASLRQTIFGLNATGPALFGARSSADLGVDFFGASSYSYYGTTNGNLRLRRADIRLGWGGIEAANQSHDEIHLGVDAPLISPLSPTSFATVAMPALAWSGNLWSWAPQLQYRHTFSLSASQSLRTLQLEGGLWDPPVVGYSGSTAAPVLSAGEISRRPGLLSRMSVHGGSAEHPFVLGVGGYNDRQTFYEDQQIQMWAVTGDWQIPLSRYFQFDGEIYRGRGLGGLGGGTYKDVLTGIDRSTGLSRTIGLNAAGGWAQLKANLFQGAEINFIYGQDGGYAADFRKLNLSASTYALEQSTRNQMTVMNFIYRPRTYLILSPEYRHIVSWRIAGLPATANIFTLSLGYQF